MNSNSFWRKVTNLIGLRELAGFQMSLGGTLLQQRGAVRWFKTGRIVLVLTGVLVAFVWLSPALHAGIIFAAGTETVGPGGNVSVPITAGYSSPTSEASGNWINAGFNLLWSQGVLNLQLTPVTLTGSPLPLTTGNFNSLPGELRFTWSDSTGFGSAVPDGSTLFTVNFIAVGGPGSSTPVNFTTPDTIGLLASGSLTFIDPTGSPGQVSVIPEPINWALGLFACVLIGSATVRWISSRRISMQSAKALS
jgi:hypothetical protein